MCTIYHRGHGLLTGFFLGEGRRGPERPPTLVSQNLLGERTHFTHKTAEKGKKKGKGLGPENVSGSNRKRRELHLIFAKRRNEGELVLSKKEASEERGGGTLRNH